MTTRICRKATNQKQKHEVVLKILKTSYFSFKICPWARIIVSTIFFRSTFAEPVLSNIVTWKRLLSMSWRFQCFAFITNIAIEKKTVFIIRKKKLLTEEMADHVYRHQTSNHKVNAKLNNPQKLLHRYRLVSNYFHAFSDDVHFTEVN